MTVAAEPEPLKNISDLRLTLTRGQYLGDAGNRIKTGWVSPSPRTTVRAQWWREVLPGVPVYGNAIVIRGAP